jgi:hypothetical protein
LFKSHLPSVPVSPQLFFLPSPLHFPPSASPLQPIPPLALPASATIVVRHSFAFFTIVTTLYKRVDHCSGWIEAYFRSTPKGADKDIRGVCGFCLFLPLFYQYCTTTMISSSLYNQFAIFLPPKIFPYLPLTC